MAKPRDFLAELAEVARGLNGPESVANGYRRAFSALYPREDNFHPAVPSRFSRKLADWQPLRGDYPIRWRDKVWNLIAGRRHSKFFEGFTKSEVERSGLIRAHRRYGAQVILYSGIEYEARARFKPVADYVAETLHPQVSVILNPDDKHMSGLHTKMATAVIMGRAVVFDLEGAELTDELFLKSLALQGGGCDFYPRDDDYAVLAKTSYHLGLRTYCAGDVEEAKQQPHLKGIDIPTFTPAMIETGRIPVSDPNLEILTRDMADPNFHNHPVLRINEGKFS